MTCEGIQRHCAQHRHREEAAELTELHLLAHLLGDADAASVEPFFASVTRYHELASTLLNFFFVVTDAPAE